MRAADTSVSLVPIDRDGVPHGYAGTLAPAAAEQLRATSELYTRVGFDRPWLCYLAVAGETAIGICGFKSPPRDGRVEIAHSTFPGFEGRGLATAMAARLVAIVREHAPSVVPAAQTLPQRNASHRVLEKLGFRHVQELDDPEDGRVWEWQLGTQDAAMERV